MIHSVCWNVIYTTPLEIEFYHYLRMQCYATSSLSFNQIILVITILYPMETTTLRHFEKLTELKKA